MATQSSIARRKSTAVVYIVYGPYGIEPARRFLESYERCDAGAAHQLVIACKAVAPAEQMSLRALLKGIAHEEITVPDGGFDLGTYRHVARSTDHARYCFLNSNSQLLATGWLAKLEAALDRPRVFVAGATASYQSLATDMLRMVGMRRTWRAISIAKRHLIHAMLRRLYPPFPNPHVRTNGFLIRRQDFLDLRMGSLRTKQDATRFESGWRSMTRQLRRRGGTAVIVEAAGDVLAEDTWATPEMFWRGNQRSLLIGDNQTRRFDEADAEERAELFRYAWTGLAGDAATRRSIAC